MTESKGPICSSCGHPMKLKEVVRFGDPGPMSGYKIYGCVNEECELVKKAKAEKKP